jgi:hypothetical protein
MDELEEIIAPRVVINQILKWELPNEEYQTSLEVHTAFIKDLYQEELSSEYRMRLFEWQLGNLFNDSETQRRSGQSLAFTDLTRWSKNAAANPKAQSIISYSEYYAGVQVQRERHYVTTLKHKVSSGRVFKSFPPEYRQYILLAVEYIGFSILVSPLVGYQKDKMTPFVITLSNWNILSLPIKTLMNWYPATIYRSLK